MGLKKYVHIYNAIDKLIILKWKCSKFYTCSNGVGVQKIKGSKNIEKI